MAAEETQKNSLSDNAESVIKSLLKTNQRGEKILSLTTSKIRNILAMTADIYNDARLLQSDELTKSIKDRIEYLRVRVLYEAGRDASVKEFVQKSKILDEMKKIKTKTNYIYFNRYMEALVAWHRFLGGKD